MKQLVILGAGYGGLMTALKLEEKVRHLKDVKIILVDKNEFHQYLHLSYEIVTGVKKVDDFIIPLSEIIGQKRIQFFQATVENIDLANKIVRTNRGSLSYFELVVALGSEPNFFNIKGAEEHAFCVCSVESAAQIKDELKRVLAQDKDAKIVIGGGGFTGVELAGEIADEIKCCVTIIEGENKLLSAWGIPEFSNRVATILTEMGTKLVFNKRIIELKPNVIVLSDESQIEYSLFIWTGGVQGSRIASNSGLNTGKGNRVLINEFCEASGFPGVYVLGDSALVVDPKTGEILPQCIEIALQQAHNVAKNLFADITESQRMVYVPKFSGLILAVGEKYGIGRISGIKVEGRLALMVKKVVHLHYIYDIAGLTETLETCL